jgi:sulfane dehydrogenase subunit SoxC
MARGRNGPPVSDASPSSPEKPISRRALLAAAAGAAGASLVTRISDADASSTAQSAPAATPASHDTTRVPGPGPSSLGTRSSFEQSRRLVGGVSSGTPHQDLHGIITPSDLHFERHHAGVPTVDPSTYTLLIHGLVDRPLVFSLAELKRLPSVSRIYFLECSGNFPRNAPEEITPQQVAPLTSTSEWTGVPLAVLLREAGVDPAATWLLAEGQDAAVMTRSIPVEKAWDDALVAYGQNGEALRPEQGYPVRLLCPGWEGNMSVKWLRRIELSDQPFMTRQETARYTEQLKGGRARQFSFVMDARSVITAPAYPTRLEPGWHEIRGIAWSGRGRISRVDISFDEGRSWVEADLQEPVLSKAHTRFRLLWNWLGGETTILSRATDETGYVQPTVRELVAARGVGGTYHLNPVTGWRVRRDGTVVYRTEEWA